jgi:hypothetical protein
MFLFPDTRHLKPGTWHLTPKTLRFGAWSLGFHKFALLHHSITPTLHGFQSQLAMDKGPGDRIEYFGLR